MTREARGGDTRGNCADGGSAEVAEEEEEEEEEEESLTVANSSEEARVTSIVSSGRRDTAIERNGMG